MEGPDDDYIGLAKAAVQVAMDLFPLAQRGAEGVEQGFLVSSAADTLTELRRALHEVDPNPPELRPAREPKGPVTTASDRRQRRQAEKEAWARSLSESG